MKLKVKYIPQNCSVLLHCTCITFFYSWSCNKGCFQPPNHQLICINDWTIWLDIKVFVTLKQSSSKKHWAKTLFWTPCGLSLRRALQVFTYSYCCPCLGTPRSPPTALFRVRGHTGVPQKVIQKSSSYDAFTVLNCGAGRRSVNAGLADHSVGHWAVPLMGQPPPAPPSV